MAKLRKGGLCIGLSKGGLAVLHTHRGQKSLATIPLERTSEDTAPTPDQLLQRCLQFLIEAECSGMLTEVVLADDWVRLYMVPPPQGTWSRQDCQAAAAMRFQMLYGEAADGWAIQADWNARHVFLACAIPHVLLNALQQVALERRLLLVSIRPQFISVWNRQHSALNPKAWLGVAHGGTLTLGAVVRQRLFAVCKAEVPADTRGGLYLDDLVRREALRLNLPIPDRVQLVGKFHDASASSLVDREQHARGSKAAPSAFAPARKGMTP